MLWPRREYIVCPLATVSTSARTTNMKVLLISTTLIVAALGAAPAPPAGWTPSGRLLLVPARLEAYPPPAEYPQTTAQPEANGTRVAQESESDESQSQKQLESGEYYVLLPDGRLQLVKYATAALKTDDSEETPTQDTQVAQNDQSAQYNGAEGSNYFQQQKFQTGAYYVQAQEEQKESQSAQYNNAQGPYKFEQQKYQPGAYYVQAQQEQKESQSAQYNNAQGPYKFEQQKYQPGAYYVQAQQEQKESQSAQYNNAQGPYKFEQQKYQPAAYPVFIRPTQQSESSQYKNAEAESKSFQQAQYPAYQQFQQKSFSADSKFQQVKQEPSNFQIELVQFPLQGSEQFSQTKLQFSEPKSAQNKAEEKKDDDEEATGFEANVQYRDVKPISSPIYAYNPAPVVRILKK